MALKIEENRTLAPWTTLGLGGACRWYARAQSETDVLEALRWALERGVAWMILGDGSNVVVGDVGFEGLVLHLNTRGIDVHESADEVFVTAQAGEPWDAFVAYCMQRGWAGLECLSGIPGRVGASPIQNVGAYGQEVSETIASVRVYDAQVDQIADWSNSDCEFCYRDSVFKRQPPGRYVVLAVRFRLPKHGKPSVRYGELSRALEGETLIAGSAGLSRVRDKVLELRRSKAMVIEPSEPNSRSAGSFFTNPIVTIEKADALNERDATMPRFNVRRPDGSHGVKLAAAWLIEKAGFAKGTRRGAVGISEKHALALVHYGQGSSDDLLALAQEIRAGVYETFDIVLEPEPRLVGCQLPSLRCEQSSAC